MRLAVNVIIFLIMIQLLNSCSNDFQPDKSDVIIENKQFKLMIGHDAKPISLIHKASGQECLQPLSDRAINNSVFSITESRPYDGDEFLKYPSESRTYEADSLYRDGDKLIVSFSPNKWIATIALKITDDYIGFAFEKLDFKMGISHNIQVTFDELTLLQLPVRNRENYGDWLNVIWDNDVAINIIGTDPFGKIDGIKYKDYTMLYATAIKDIKLLGVGAALIVSDKKSLLTHIDKLERDYNLPLGAESRKNEKYNASYYWCDEAYPSNIDEHLEFAKKAGLTTFMVYYPSFATTPGHFPWNAEYPNGMEDLIKVTGKIRAAGMLPGLHIHYNKAGIDDAYVTPVPDPRLNLRKHFTLAGPLNLNDSIVYVEEIPGEISWADLKDGRRTLKIENEIISFSNFSNVRPYCFTGCSRGFFNTIPSAHPKGVKMGILDIDDWPVFARFDQRTSIQDEVGERLAEIYEKPGFNFVYLDGAEDVHPPYWFYTSWSQWRVYKLFKSPPYFAEGAAKTHFSWHMLSRSNAHDIYRPEVLKQAIIMYPAHGAQTMAKDFTGINFGWTGYVVPDGNSIGTQPDMLEYVTSRGAAWNCPFSFRGNLKTLKAHPRTNDNLEIIRRWEVIRADKGLNDEQKKSLQNLDQEHILLINEKGEFELCEYTQMTDAAGGNKGIRTFVINRSGETYFVFWHPYGNGKLQLDVDARKVHLFRELGKEVQVQKSQDGVEISYGDRQFMKIDLPGGKALEIFKKAKILQ